MIFAALGQGSVPNRESPDGSEPGQGMLRQLQPSKLWQEFSAVQMESFRNADLGGAKCGLDWGTAREFKVMCRFQS